MLDAYFQRRLILVDTSCVSSQIEIEIEKKSRKKQQKQNTRTHTEKTWKKTKCFRRNQNKTSISSFVSKQKSKKQKNTTTTTKNKNKPDNGKKGGQETHIQINQKKTRIKSKLIFLFVCAFLSVSVKVRFTCKKSRRSVDFLVSKYRF